MTSGHQPPARGPWCRFRREARAVSDIDTAAADSLKVLDPKPPIREADIDERDCHVRFVPEADMFTISLDRLVGTQLNLTRNREADRLCSLEVDHQLVLGGRLHGQVARLFSLQDAIDI